MAFNLDLDQIKLPAKEGEVVDAPHPGAEFNPMRRKLEIQA